ncbi:hypothetical protein COOONC_04036 [Cooperia oncophora]
MDKGTNLPVLPTKSAAKIVMLNQMVRDVLLLGNKVGMAGRRQSVTAQISRQARRLSTVIAPQFTKIEPVNILQKVEGVEIRISDITQGNSIEE